MAIDAMKILGSLLSSGALSRGSGSSILGSVLGAVMGGGQSSGGGLGGLGDMLGGGAGRQMQGGGGIGDLLGGLLGGGGGQGGSAGGGLGDLLGMAMKQFGGNAQAAPTPASFDNVEPQQANDQAMLLIRAMINAAKADGQVDQKEQQNIVEKLGDVTQDEIDFVQRELAEPLDVDAFVHDVPRGMEEQVYTVSLMAIDLDSNPEAQYLHKLAQGLGVNPETVNMIHEKLGAPKLYS